MSLVSFLQNLLALARGFEPVYGEVGMIKIQIISVSVFLYILFIYISILFISFMFYLFSRGTDFF